MKALSLCLFASEVIVLPGADVIYCGKEEAGVWEKIRQWSVYSSRDELVKCSPNVKWNHITSQLQHMFGIQHTTSHLLHMRNANISQHLKK